MDPQDVLTLVSGIGGAALVFGVVRGLLMRSRDGQSYDPEAEYRRAMEISLEGEPEWQIELWTPQERENLGQNDLMRFIEETDKILYPPPLPPEALYARGGYGATEKIHEIGLQRVGK